MSRIRSRTAPAALEPPSIDTSSASTTADGQGVGTARHGTARRRTVRYGTVRHGTARHGTARHGTARHGTVQYGTARHGTARPSNGTPKNGADGQVPTTRPCTARPSKTRHGRVRRILTDSGDARIPDSVRRIPGCSSTHLAPRQAEPSGLTDPSRSPPPRQPSWTNVGDSARENRETAISAVRCSGTLMEYTLAPGTVLPRYALS